MSEASRKNLSLLLTAIILLSGMYFVWIKADSSFVDSVNRRQTSALHISNNSAFFEELCTEELLGNRGQSSILSRLRRVSQERDPEEVFFSMNPGFVFTSAAHQPEITETVRNDSYSGPQRIVGYIHHQDGQKG